MKKIMVIFSVLCILLAGKNTFAQEVKKVLFEEYFTKDMAAFTPPEYPDIAVKEEYPNWSFTLPSAHLTPPQSGTVGISNGYMNLKKTSAKTAYNNYEDAIYARCNLPTLTKGRYILEFTVKYPTNSTEGLAFRIYGSDGTTTLIDGLVNNSQKVVELTDGASRQNKSSTPYAMPVCGDFNVDTTITLDINLDEKNFKFYTNRLDNGRTAVKGVYEQEDRQFANTKQELMGLSAICFSPRNMTPQNATWQIKSVKLYRVETDVQYTIEGFYKNSITEENKITELEEGTELAEVIAKVQIKNTGSAPAWVQPVLGMYQGNRLVNVGMGGLYKIAENETLNIPIPISKITFWNRDSYLKFFLWGGVDTMVPVSMHNHRALGLEINDMATLRKRLQGDLSSASANPSSYFGLLDSSGKFTDIDYTMDSKVYGFGPSNALERIRIMVKAYGSVGNHWYRSEDLWEKINLTLTDWANNDYISSANWWYNEISVPSKMAEILLFDLPETTYRNTLITIAKRGLPKVDSSKVHGSSDTGANLTDKIMVAMNIAAGAKDEEAVFKYVTNLLEGELKNFHSPNEGIMHDFSFQQHRALLYSGSYGTVFASGVNKILKTISGTQFNVSKRARDCYADFVLDGQQWMFRFGKNDFNVTGRAISRQGGVGTGLFAHSQTAAKILIQEGEVDRAEELAALLSNRQSGKADSFHGAKHFWISDFTTFHRDNFYVGIRSSSTRTYNTEYMNGENIKGYFLADGVTTIMRTGLEHQDIFPVWDWNKLPGTTTRTVSAIPTPASEKGTTEFVGGVTDGTYAVSVLDYSHNSTAAKKAWFCFDQGFMALGSGIGATAGGEVFTNLNQCLLNGTVVFQKGQEVKSLAAGTSGKQTDIKWIWHDSVGYHFPEKTDVYIENTTKTGAWSQINSGQSGTLLNKNIFNLYISHGNLPKGESYVYSVLPGVTQGEMAVYENAPDMKVICNNTAQQAVWSSSAKALGTVFWSAGTVTVPPEAGNLESSISIAVDQPCLALLRKMENNQWSISLSNPKNKALTVQVVLDRMVYGENVTRDVGKGTSAISFYLPSGAMAGSSVTKIISE